MKAKWQKVRIELPTPISDKQTLSEVGDLIVERIFERTDRGYDKDGKKFPGYTKEYRDSLDFKNAGKSKSVNLQLSGDMLAAMRVLKSTKNWIEVGFDKNTVENAKADGNIRGTYGTDEAKPERARNFLGISEKELLKILRGLDVKL